MQINPESVYTEKETRYYIGVSRTTFYWLRKQRLICPIAGPGRLRFTGQEILRYLGIKQSHN